MTRADLLAPVLVAGCGRSGAWLVARLARAGRPVLALDRDRAALEALRRDAPGAGLLPGEALEPATWERPAARAARLTIGCLGSDAGNLALAALLQAAERGPVWLALRDPALMATARALGANAVCGASLADEALLAAALTRP